MTHAPSAAAERLPLLDALRGFAVLGILVANIILFSGYFFLSESARAALPSARADAIAETAMHLVVEGKFYSLFSLLFGLGFAVLLVRSEAAGRDFPAFFRRRLWILLGFGLAHAYLVWYGDILSVYALVGFALLACRRWSDRALLRGAALCFLLPIVQYVGMVYAWEPAVSYEAKAAGTEAFFGAVVAAFAGGSPLEMLKMNVAGVLGGRYPDLLFTGRLFKVMGLFLLGLWIGRRGIHANPAAHRPLLAWVALIGFAVGIPANIWLAFSFPEAAYRGLTPAGIPASIVFTLGIPPLAFAYAATFALLFLHPAGGRALAVLAPAGRMALTNYLMHSVVCLALFTGLGTGSFGRVGFAAAVGVALTLGAMQVVTSTVWLRYFRFGPAEWLWRSLTYGTRQPFRRGAPAPAPVALGA
jgi:uncharacterized protein